MSTKDSGMRVRIERDLREAFVNACQAQGLGASEVLRDFMRSFAAKHSSEQAVLFDQAGKRPAAGAARRGTR
jgi:antitoxin component of RelBE/YafQ-DinJ toxin-antitoxin module